MDLALYKDRAALHLFDVEDLGRVRAGETKTITGYLSNNTKFKMKDISYSTGDDDIKILNLPDSLSSFEVTDIQVMFNPDKERRHSLKNWVRLDAIKVVPGNGL